MPQTPELYFSGAVSGIIWKTVVDPLHGRLFIESRDTSLKQVFFSALSLARRQWLWKEISFDEPWWISLEAVCKNQLLLTVYADTNNPDKKSLIVFDCEQQKISWWKNDFSVDLVAGDFIHGRDTKYGHKELILEVKAGTEIARDSVVLQAPQNFDIIRPFQYREGSEHFETIRSFLSSKAGILSVSVIEYCELDAFIVVSAFVKEEELANYLFVFTKTGEMVLKETLGEQLKGIASDTFFIFSDFLIFVKNKRELVSYKIV